jgi:hypothetical protein
MTRRHRDHLLDDFLRCAEQMDGQPFRIDQRQQPVKQIHAGDALRHRNAEQPRAPDHPMPSTLTMSHSRTDAASSVSRCRWTIFASLTTTCCVNCRRSTRVPIQSTVSFIDIRWIGYEKNSARFIAWPRYRVFRHPAWLERIGTAGEATHIPLMCARD